MQTYFKKFWGRKLWFLAAQSAVESSLTDIYIVRLWKGTKFKNSCQRLLPCSPDTRCPQGYALFREKLPQPLIWFRSDRLDACEDSQHNVAAKFASPPVFHLLIFLFSQGCFLPFSLLRPPRFDLYDTSRIRSSIQWHNSSWWLDSG